MILNYTPHPVTVLLPDGTRRTYPSQGTARVACTTLPVLAPNGTPLTVDGVPVTCLHYGAVEGLPDFDPPTRYIVSRMVAECLHRPDLLVPGGQVRDEEGRVIGCTSFDLI